MSPMADSVMSMPGANPSMPSGPMEPMMPPEEPVGTDSVATEFGDSITPQQQSGVVGGEGKVKGVMMFEDMFPELELTEEEEKSLVSWFESDLRSAIRANNEERNNWATYRAVYCLEYFERYYPELGVGANFTSGLLLEKVLEGMDRMRKSLSQSVPYFAPDPKSSGTEVDVDFHNRASWMMQAVMDKELDIKAVIGNAGIFEYVLDGSLILEADTVYEKVPQRVLKKYTTLEELMADVDRAVSEADVEDAQRQLADTGAARMLVEQDVVTKNGLQIFRVEKVDHLIPAGIFDDNDCRFRARRMYYTANDLRILSSEGSNWYKESKVQKVMKAREEARLLRGMSRTGKDAEIIAEQLRKAEENSDLQYDWRTTDSSDPSSSGTVQPYRDVFSVYRITCLYGYKTKSDPKGMLAKRCVFDYSPEGRVILRSVTYPHFKEKPNWFHFKFGYKPKSYWGFGFGARLVQDDYLESNAVNLYLESAALASFNPFVTVHPEAGGRVPFTGGYGPGKIGYLNNVNDFKQVDVRPPSDSLLRYVLPLTKTRAENRSNVTSLVQGQTESSDPRSPATKTAMLLQQANIGLEMMVEDWNGDWNGSGWSMLAQFVWGAKYENAMYVLASGGDLQKEMGGLIVNDEAAPSGAENIVTMKELSRDLVWVGTVSGFNVNPQQRAERFMQVFQFYVPLLRELAQFNAQLYMKYALRWMRKLSQEINFAGIEYMVPTQKELMGMQPMAMQGVLESAVRSIQGGNVPQTLPTGGVQPVQGGA